MIYLEGVRSCDVFNGIFLIRIRGGKFQGIILIMAKRRHPPDDGKEKASF